MCFTTLISFADAYSDKSGAACDDAPTDADPACNAIGVFAGATGAIVRRIASPRCNSLVNLVSVPVTIVPVTVIKPLPSNTLGPIISPPV